MTCECLMDVSNDVKDQMEVIILREVYESITNLPFSSKLGMMAFKMPIEEYALLNEDEVDCRSIHQKTVSQSWDAMRVLYALFLENDVGVNLDGTYAYVPLATDSIAKFSKELLKAIKPRLYS